MEFPRNAEIFRAIDGFVNYEVSTHGRVRNSKSGRILKPGLNSPGYYYVILSQDGKKTTCQIHRVVAETFINNPNNYETVDHIDKNRVNNNYLNLRWANASMQARNRGIAINNTSNIKGVAFDKKNNHWKAYITNNDGRIISKTYSLLRYENAQELATDWRREKEIEYNYNTDY
jgi:hypothetical protein